jgi:hypothetical protein
MAYVKKAAFAALLAGCSASLGNTDPDARSNGGVDGAVNGDKDAAVAIDAPPACLNGRALYLNFDGVTLTKAAASDAAANTASWIGVTTATIPAYRLADANRDAEILAIVDGVKQRLATTPITVYTQRPQNPPYVMVVFGGTKTNVNSVYSYATNEHDCGDSVKSDVGWVSDVPGVALVPDLVIGTIGWGLGLNGTSDPNDCMCGWANNCADATTACTLANQIPSTASLAPAVSCPNQNPQDEITAFTTGYCQ